MHEAAERMSTDLHAFHKTFSLLFFLWFFVVVVVYVYLIINAQPTRMLFISLIERAEDRGETCSV